MISASQRAFREASVLRSKAKVDDAGSTQAQFKQDGNAFEYLERIMESVLTAHAGLEAFANDHIPVDYIYACHALRGSGRVLGRRGENMKVNVWDIAANGQVNVDLVRSQAAATATGALLISLLAAPACAADGGVGYRGGVLGMTPKSLIAAIARHFPHRKVTKTPFGDYVSVTDQAGKDFVLCPVADIKQANCLKAQFIHWPQNGVRKLTVIQVQQSFSPPVPLTEVMDKLQKSYGHPRRRYDKSEVAEPDNMDPAKRPGYASPQCEDTVYLWGGRAIPAPPFRPAQGVHDGHSSIGGQYVTAVLHKIGLNVSGLELRIVDAERAVDARREMQLVIDQRESDKKRRAVESLKF